MDRHVYIYIYTYVYIYIYTYICINRTNAHSLCAYWWTQSAHSQAKLHMEWKVQRQARPMGGDFRGILNGSSAWKILEIFLDGWKHRKTYPLVN